MTVLYMSFIQINILFGLNWDYFRSLCDFDLIRGFKGVEFEVLLEKIKSCSISLALNCKYFTIIIKHKCNLVYKKPLTNHYIC